MPSAFERGLRGVGRAVLDALLPPTCLTCDQPVGGPHQLCTDCFNGMRFITAPCCVRCGIPFESADRGGPRRTCPPCEAQPPPWNEARAALRYDDASKRLVLPLKYGDRNELARALAPMMARAGATLLAQADLLVPVPLHRRRLISRRYNQSAELAKALAGRTGRPALLDALRRIKPTAPLADLSAQRRAAELAGAIAIRPRRRAAIDGARVLLIDDVLTSGTTARACTEVLLAAGALQVDVLAAARVHSRARDH